MRRMRCAAAAAVLTARRLRRCQISHTGTTSVFLTGYSGTLDAPNDDADDEEEGDMVRCTALCAALPIAREAKML